MRSIGISEVGRMVLILTLVLLGLPCGAVGQMRSAAPTILQSVVLHPCVSAAMCEVEPDGEKSVIPPTRSSGSMSGRLTPATSISSPGSTTYVTNPAVSAQVRAMFVLGLAKKLTGAQTDAIVRNLRENDPVVRWAGMVSGDGLHTGDLADALASYWVLNWGDGQWQREQPGGDARSS